MAIDEDHDNHYRVDYAYSTYDEDVDIWIDSDYNSKPFATEAEARTYANRVIDRTNINPGKVKLYKLTIIYVDIQYWDEHGDFKIIQELMF